MTTMGWVCDHCGSESDDEHAPCSCDGDTAELIDEIRRLRAEVQRLRKRAPTRSDIAARLRLIVGAMWSEAYCDEVAGKLLETRHG